MNRAKYKKSICWIRRDLRLKDHKSLYEACLQSEQVIIVFVFDINILKKLDSNDRRVTFIMESLDALSQQVEDQGSKLIIDYGDPIEVIPQIAKKISAEAIFTNEDYENYAIKRDLKVSQQLTKQSCEFHIYKDQVVFAPHEVLKKDNSPYKVFTPYKKAWLQNLNKNKDLQDFKPNLKKLCPVSDIKYSPQFKDLKSIGFETTSNIIKGGSKESSKSLKKFLGQIRDYKKQRDFPYIKNGTSYISPHLRFGTISIRELFRSSIQSNNEGNQTWMSELIWREFYQMILKQFPQVENTTFLPQYSKIKWPGEAKHFIAWKKGVTGYPIIDAAMRHFAKTGWMHNRLRMIVASFLVKDLLIDWKKGEEYFAANLLDFDLSANNGGWQWSASTGCDAQPYFRIFNPISQSQKFDPEGEFIKEHLPELAGFSKKDIHFPSQATWMDQTLAKCIIGKDYPAPIVDHKVQRDLALDLFKKYKLGTNKK